jgi:hypothetical protein
MREEVRSRLQFVAAARRLRSPGAGRRISTSAGACSSSQIRVLTAEAERDDDQPRPNHGSSPPPLVPRRATIRTSTPRRVSRINCCGSAQLVLP